MNRYPVAMYFCKKNLYSLSFVLLFSACSHTLASTQASNKDVTKATVPHSSLLKPQTAALKVTPDVFLQGIRSDDIAQAQASAKKHLLPHWSRIMERSTRVRQRLVTTLKDMNAPLSLQIIPIVESGYQPYALSSTGAMGLWQLMPHTARGLGIKKNPYIDGRRHIESSTRAAVQYLQTQYKRFGNWPLAFAAYNMGPNGLARRLNKTPWQTSDGLENMPVPAVTRTYVLHIVGLTALLKMHILSFPEPVPTTTIALESPVDLKQLAYAADLSEELLFQYNPGLHYSQYLQHDITLHIPKNIDSKLQQLNDSQRPKYIQIKVESGDSLWKLAHHNHITITHLRKLNPKLRQPLRIGAIVTVPANALARATAALNPLLSHGRRIRYKVRRGDSLWSISRRFGTTTRSIARANQLSNHSLIRPGDTLWILAHIRPS